MLARRKLLTFALAAPAIIRTPGLLMPVKPTKPKPLFPGNYIANIVDISVNSTNTGFDITMRLTDDLRAIDKVLRESWDVYKIPLYPTHVFLPLSPTKKA